MNHIQVLKEEHQNILSMLDIIETACLRLLDTDDVSVEDFRRMISFVRLYADAHHHGKEEKILFEEMLKKGDPVAEKLVRFGMFVEHDMGRAHILALSDALDSYEKDPSSLNKLSVLGSAKAYIDLLRRHIAKEDDLVYPFAQKLMSPSEMEWIDRVGQSYEEQPEQAYLRKENLELLDELKKKYV